LIDDLLEIADAERRLLDELFERRTVLVDRGPVFGLMFTTSLLGTVARSPRE
jgi:hypothetical protein